MFLQEKIKKISKRKIKIILRKKLAEIKKHFNFNFKFKKPQLLVTGILLMVSVLTFQIFGVSNIKGATFGWVQSTWSGGADASATANHNTDQTSWTKYAAKDAAVDLTTSPGDIKIASTPGSATQTTDIDFNAGTKTNVQVGGSGVGGDVGLAMQPTPESGNRWRDMTSIPTTNGNGAAMVAVGGDTFYAFKGNGTTGFYRYSISSNIWTTMAVVPGSIDEGGALVYPAFGDYIYGYRGTSSNAFYRYSISENTWTTMATTPGDISNGGSLVYPGAGDYIYGYRGGSTSFYRYSISGNSWAAMAVTPGIIGGGGSLVYPGSGDYIYGYRGNISTDFYRYSISGNSWTTMAATPGSGEYSGASLSCSGSGDYIYGSRGWGETAFYRYSISTNTWISIAATPEGIIRGGSLVYPGTGDYIYASSGGMFMFRYSISGNSWSNTSLPSIPGGTLDSSVSTGNDYLYSLQRDSLNFYRYSVTNDSWVFMKPPPNIIGIGNALVYPGAGDYIYGYRGNSVDFYRYSILNNSWTTMATAPGSVGKGSSLVYPGLGDYIYGFQGGYNTAFYRYSISGNTWTTMASTPEVIYRGGSLVYPGAGDYLYGYQGNSTGFYRYSISGNTWTVMAAVPGKINDGASLVYPGSGDYLYGSTGEGDNLGFFFRYSITNNTWTDQQGNGVGFNALVYPGAGNYLYAQGVSSGTLLRYSLIDNANPKFWEQVAVNNNTISISNRSSGKLAVSTGGDFIYAVDGSSSNFYRYSLSGKVWTTITTTLGIISYYGGSLVYPGSGDFIYGYQGNSSTAFYRYSISENTWTTMATTPGDISNGGSLVYPGSGDYIYGYQGGATAFYRYSISSNSWTTMATTPGFISSGGSLVYPGSGDYIYGYQGGINYGFYRYSISGNSWTTMAATPGAISDAGSLAYPGSGDYIYGYQGGTSAFYRYSISNNVWMIMVASLGDYGSLVYPGTGNYLYSFGKRIYVYRTDLNLSGGWMTLSAMPGAIAAGGSLVYPGSGDFMYGYRGGGSMDFYRYSISEHSWTVMAVTPGSIGEGAALVYPGVGDYLYGYRGAGTTFFYRYSISGNSWTTLVAAPGAISDGGSLVYPGSGDYLYGFQGGHNSAFYRYSISNNSWATMGVIPGSIYGGASLIYPGNGEFIYGFQGGGSKIFYRYSISSNSWTKMAATLGNISNGGSLTSPGSGDYLYGYQGGNSTVFYRYSISENAWMSMASTSGSIGAGASLVYPISGNYIYGTRGGGTTDFYRYSLSSFAPSGSFTSSVQDTGINAGLTNLSYNATANGQTLTMDVRAGNTATPDGTWTSWLTNLSNGGDITSLVGKRYVQYKANLATSDGNVTPTLSDTAINFNYYPTNQTLTSSVYDTTDAANVLAKLQWTKTLPANTNATFQIRTSADKNTWTDWEGPGGTNATSFADSTGGEAMPSNFGAVGNNRYLQYKVNLTSDGANTPTVSDLSLTYVVNAPPQIQNITAVEDTIGKINLTYEVKDADTNTGASHGFVNASLEYCSANCSNAGNETWTLATTFTGLGNVAVNETSFTQYSATWNAKVDFPEQNPTNFKLRIKINDGDMANNIAYGQTPTFTLDTKNPIINGLSVNLQTEHLTLSQPQDDSAYDIYLTTGQGFPQTPQLANAQNLTYPYTLDYADLAAIDTNGTVSMKIVDHFGNTSATYSYIVPPKPERVIYFDISNSTENSYSELLTWKAISGSNLSYKICRASVDDGTIVTDPSALNYSTCYTVADLANNFYIDNSLDTNKHYYYRVYTQNTLDGSVSNLSNIVEDTPNGNGASDSTPPKLFNINLDEDLDVTATSITINWQADEISNSGLGYTSSADYDHSQYDLEKINYAPQMIPAGETHSYTLTGLEPGTTYYLRPRSNDVLGNQGISGNWGQDNAIITVRTKDGPAIKRFTIKETTNNSVTLTWSTTTPANSSIYYSQTKSNGQLVIDDENAPNSSSGLIKDETNYTLIHELKVPNLKVGEKYFFSLKSAGANGNFAIENNAGNYYEFTTDQDTSKPVITLDEQIQPILITSSKAVVQWLTDQPTTTQLEYKKTSQDDYTTYAFDQNLFNTSHYVMLENLEANTHYQYKVQASDINGNTESTDTYEFKTLRDPIKDHDPLSKITFAEKNPAVLTDTVAMLAFSTDQIANCFAKYGPVSNQYDNAVPIVEEENIFTKTHSMQIMGLIFSSKYFYQIECIDNNGASVKAEEQEFTTQEKNYTASGSGGNGIGQFLSSANPLVISNVKVASTTGENVVITWDTDQPGSSSVRYGLDSNYGITFGDDLVNSSKDNYVKPHSVTITGLVPATKYLFKTTSVDAFGNIAESSESSFTTASPSSLSSIAAQSTELGQAIITWNTSTETTSIVEYGLSTTYGEKKESSTKTKEHSLNLSNLNQGVTYHYRVRGQDKDGNLYASSDQTFQPKSPAKITNISIDSVDEHSASVSFKTNVPTDSSVSYTDTSSSQTTGSQGSKDLTLDHKIELTNLSQGTTFAVWISVKDEQGNPSSLQAPDFTTGKDENPPSIENVKTDSALTQSDSVQTIISWKTNEQATTSIFYKEGLSGEEKELKITDNLTTSHIGVLTIFKPGTVYSFKVKSVDASGNESVSSDFVLLTPSKRANIIQVIIGNFGDIFGWAKLG